ncbi:MAG: ABC transporter ATP-binding protein [Butyrivibrio sp.]
MICIENLTKVYKLSKRQMQKEKTKKNTKVAVSNVSLTAKPGEIFGLLGPNGAGKTTTLRCLATLLTPTEGKISVCGYDTVKDGDEVRKRIGFLTNEIKLDPQFTADYLFDFFGKLHGVDDNTLKKRKGELFEYFGITPFKDKKIDELSTGMKQKAAIAVCLVHDPEIVIFDEPTSGLDILTARLVTDYLKKLKEDGKSVVISTHIMSEAEKLCDRVAVIIDGQKVCESTLQDIYVQYGCDNLEDAFFEMYKVNHKEEA